MARPLTLALAVLATLLALGLTLNLQPAAFAPGGEATVIAEWALLATSTTPERAQEGRLCDTATPCDAAELDARAAAGDHCALLATARPHPYDDHPLLLRNATWLVHASIASGDLQPLPDGSRNFTHESTTYPHPAPPTTWWRGSTPALDLVVPVPCDAAEVRVALNLHAESWRGSLYERAWSFDVRLRPE